MPLLVPATVVPAAIRAASWKGTSHSGGDDGHRLAAGQPGTGIVLA